MPRIAFDGGLERDQRAVPQTEMLQRDAQVVGRLGRCGRAAHRMLEGAQRAVHVVAVAQQVAEVGPGVGVVGLDADRFAIRRLGRARVAQALLQDAQQRPRVGALRQSIHGRAGLRERVRVAALQEQCVRTLQRDGGVGERGRGCIHRASVKRFDTSGSGDKSACGAASRRIRRVRRAQAPGQVALWLSRCSLSVLNVVVPSVCSVIT